MPQRPRRPRAHPLGDAAAHPRADPGLEERILFGSEAPTAKVRLEEGLQQVHDLHLGADTEAAILGGNAERLCGALFRRTWQP